MNPVPLMTLVSSTEKSKTVTCIQYKKLGAERNTLRETNTERTKVCRELEKHLMMQISEQMKTMNLSDLPERIADDSQLGYKNLRNDYGWGIISVYSENTRPRRSYVRVDSDQIPPRWDQWAYTSNFLAHVSSRNAQRSTSDFLNNTLTDFMTHRSHGIQNVTEQHKNTVYPYINITCDGPTKEWVFTDTAMRYDCVLRSRANEEEKTLALQIYVGKMCPSTLLTRDTTLAYAFGVVILSKMYRDELDEEQDKANKIKKKPFQRLVELVVVPSKRAAISVDWGMPPFAFASKMLSHEIEQKTSSLTKEIVYQLTKAAHGFEATNIDKQIIDGLNALNDPTDEERLLFKLAQAKTQSIVHSDFNLYLDVRVRNMAAPAIAMFVWRAMKLQFTIQIYKLLTDSMFVDIYLMTKGTPLTGDAVTDTAILKNLAAQLVAANTAIKAPPDDASMQAIMNDVIFKNVSAYMHMNCDIFPFSHNLGKYQTIKQENDTLMDLAGLFKVLYKIQCELKNMVAPPDDYNFNGIFTAINNSVKDPMTMECPDRAALTQKHGGIEFWMSEYENAFAIHDLVARDYADPCTAVRLSLPLKIDPLQLTVELEPIQKEAPHAFNAIKWCLPYTAAFYKGRKGRLTSIMDLNKRNYEFQRIAGGGLRMPISTDQYMPNSCLICLELNMHSNFISFVALVQHFKPRNMATIRPDITDRDNIRPIPKSTPVVPSVVQVAQSVAQAAIQRGKDNQTFQDMQNHFFVFGSFSYPISAANDISFEQLEGPDPTPKTLAENYETMFKQLARYCSEDSEYVQNEALLLQHGDEQAREYIQNFLIETSRNHLDVIFENTSGYAVFRNALWTGSRLDEYEANQRRQALLPMPGAVAGPSGSAGGAIRKPKPVRISPLADNRPPLPQVPGAGKAAAAQAITAVVPSGGTSVAPVPGGSLVAVRGASAAKPPKSETETLFDTYCGAGGWPDTSAVDNSQVAVDTGTDSYYDIAGVMNPSNYIDTRFNQTFIHQLLAALAQNDEYFKSSSAAISVNGKFSRQIIAGVIKRKTRILVRTFKIFDKYLLNDTQYGTLYQAFKREFFAYQNQKDAETTQSATDDISSDELWPAESDYQQRNPVDVKHVAHDYFTYKARGVAPRRAGFSNLVLIPCVGLNDVWTRSLGFKENFEFLCTHIEMFERNEMSWLVWYFFGNMLTLGVDVMKNTLDYSSTLETVKSANDDGQLEALGQIANMYRNVFMQTENLIDAYLFQGVSDQNIKVKLEGFQYELKQLFETYKSLFSQLESLANDKFQYPKEDVIQLKDDWMVTPLKSFRSEPELTTGWNSQMPTQSTLVAEYLKNHARRVLWHNDEYRGLFRKNLKIIDTNTGLRYENMDRMKSLVHSVFDEMSKVVINDASQKRVATAFFAKAIASSFNPVVEFANARDEKLQDQFVRDHDNHEESTRPSRKQRTETAPKPQ
jgi:hypothetical protein